MAPRALGSGPRRIVCLTEEPTEILYALGEGERVVGISAYTLRPAEARRDKPVVSAFVGGSVSKIKNLKPDLVLGFSDIQANLARDLIAENLQVLIFNQRSVQEILDVVLAIGRLVNAAGRAESLVRAYEERLAQTKARAESRRSRPRVYFEEWDDPMICGIRWVSELIELAGGIDVFRDRAEAPAAKGRIVTTLDVVSAAPDVYLASWCGKPFAREQALARDGFADLPFARTGRIHELDPSIILQPGPAALTDGLDFLERVLSESEGKAPNPPRGRRVGARVRRSMDEAS